MMFLDTIRIFLVRWISHYDYARVCIYLLLKVCSNYTHFASTSCICTLMRNVTRRRIFSTALLDQSKRFISRHNHNVFYKYSLPCEVGFCQLREIVFYLVPHMTLVEFLPELNLLHPSLAIEFIPRPSTRDCFRQFLNQTKLLEHFGPVGAARGRSMSLAITRQARFRHA